MLPPSNLLTAAVASVACFTVAATLWDVVRLHRKRKRREKRAKLIEKERAKDEEAQETLFSILDHFSGLVLDDTCTVEESNKKRTTRYYQLSRDAHLYDLVVGVKSYPLLRNRREAEMERIFKYYNYQKVGIVKSHRTILAMCDAFTSQILAQAREFILEPLHYSTDISAEGVWIPECSIIPPEDMHVTVALPWWWHTLRPNNDLLSQELVARFRSALVLNFHHAFQIELERIVLLGGKTLVALWRTVGERQGSAGERIFDRHGEQEDPFVKLRTDIVHCFTSMEKKEPLTYKHRFGEERKSERPSLERQDSDDTIVMKTPGLGNHDGFIHTTLARLPLDCLSMTDVELAPLHRLCREATATYCGHRMVIHSYRFIETTGRGGESNPCRQPNFDETILAPPRVTVQQGAVLEVNDFSKQVVTNATIGAPPNLAERPSALQLFYEDE
jgi:hypothetical protein